MSYHEKSSILSIVSFPLIYIGYWIYVLQKLRSGSPSLVEDLSFWAISILIFIGVSIIARIILEILFNIANAVGNAIASRAEEDPTLEDERDRLFELKSTRINSVVVGIGFVLSLVTLAFNWPAYIMVNILYFAFIGATITSEVSKLRYYRQGM